MADDHLKNLTLLERIAEAVEPVRSSKHAAAIVFKNNIVSIGTNQIKTHPFQKKYAKNPCALFLHAETCAICRALKNISLNDLSKASLYILRIKREREGGNFIWGNSMPCAGCMRCIVEFNINKVIFSVNDNKSKSYEVVNI